MSVFSNSEVCMFKIIMNQHKTILEIKPNKKIIVDNILF